MAGLPEQRLFVREKDSGLSVLYGAPSKLEADSACSRVPCTSAQFSTDGKLLALVTEAGVSILDAATLKQTCNLALPRVSAIAFSPLATFLQVFQKPNGQDKNLGVFRVPSGEPVFQLFQKSFLKEMWPTLQFSADESVACRLATNEAQIFDGTDLGKGMTHRIRVEKIAGVQLAPSGKFVAVYVSEVKGAPATVRVLPVDATPETAPVARRSFFKSSSARLTWSPASLGVLVLATSDVDKTNRSYYGETALHYLSSDGSVEGAVPLNKEGPIHDAQWSPCGRYFVAVYGFMPSRATVFDAKCKVIADFGSGPRNHARWSPQGQFLLLAGFGNLPGDMEFWDWRTQTKLGACKAALSVTAEWSPDGRGVMTATTMPRLQVDNVVKFFKYDGSLLFEKPYAGLFQAEWRPFPSGTFPERPPSPSKGGAATAGGRSGGSSQPSTSAGGSALKQPAAGAKPAAYRPPHASSANAAALKAQLFGEEATSELSKNALKNKKRREKEKQKKEEEVTVSMGGLSVAPGEAAGAGGDAEIGGELGKRVRALQKKLRQIDDLKKKVEESGGGISSLAPAQREKLAQESGLRKELEELMAQT